MKGPAPSWAQLSAPLPSAMMVFSEVNVDEGVYVFTLTLAPESNPADTELFAMVDDFTEAVYGPVAVWRR